MATIISFNINSDEYAIAFKTNAEATKYINSLVSALRSDGDLKSFRHTGKDSYTLKTGSKVAGIGVSSAASEGVYYELDHSEDDNYAKTYRSKSLDELIKIAYTNISDHSEYEDVMGEWVNDSGQKYTLYIVNGDKRTRHADLLLSLDFNSSPLLKPILGTDDNDYRLKKITKPSSSLIFSALESFLFVWLGIIVCLIETNSYIKTVSNFYGDEYLIKDHLRQTVSNNGIGLIIGLILNAILVTASHIGSLSNFTFNWPWAVATTIICLIAFSCFYRKIDNLDK